MNGWTGKVKGCCGCVREGGWIGAGCKMVIWVNFGLRTPLWYDVWIRRKDRVRCNSKLNYFCQQWVGTDSFISPYLCESSAWVDWGGWGGVQSFAYLYMGAEKSLARPGRKQANVSVRMAWISFGALPCRGEKNLMFVEIARVRDMLPSLFPAWSG